MAFRYATKDKDNYPDPGPYERLWDFYKYNDRINNLNTNDYLSFVFYLIKKTFIILFYNTNYPYFKDIYNNN